MTLITLIPIVLGLIWFERRNGRYDAQRDGEDGENLIARVQHFSEVLSDRERPRDERLEAPKFLVHFVGD